MELSSPDSGRLGRGTPGLPHDMVSPVVPQDLQPILSEGLSAPIAAAFEAALREARRYEGATAPNPPVGAAALDFEGRILGVFAHKKAGTAHAEAGLLASLQEQGLLDQVAHLVVTLEPCNHQGRTPPCTDAILAAGIRRVTYGVPDPNPQVAGGGGSRLAQAGVVVSELCPASPTGDEKNRQEPWPSLRRDCEDLISTFAYRSRQGLPWVTVKQAVLPDGSMIPPPGLKTFTSEDSLTLAHALRRRSDAIVTGSGTVLADLPEFTVRRLSDHPGKRRWLSVLDRRGRVSERAPSWLREAGNRGFDVRLASDLATELKWLYNQGVMEVLVEAGPTLTKAVIEGDFWCRHVLIRKAISEGQPDEIHDLLNPRLRSF